MSEDIQVKEEVKNTETPEDRPTTVRPLVRSGKKVDSDYIFQFGLPKWYSSPKLRVDFLPNRNKERGVFAKEDIEAGEILEEVPFINIDFHYESRDVMEFLLGKPRLGSSFIKHMKSMAKAFSLRSVDEYIFNWDNGDADDPSKPSFAAIPLGNGCIYNSSPIPNAEWFTTTDSFIFRTLDKIKQGKEIRTFYGYFLSDSGRKITAGDVLYLYVEMNEQNRLCLRAMTQDAINSIGIEQLERINDLCSKGDVLINHIDFYTQDKKVAASMKANKVTNGDFFYEKMIESHIRTRYSYLEMKLQYTFDKNKKETITLFNR